MYLPPPSSASRANLVASPRPSVGRRRYGKPRARRVRSSSGISSPTCRLPACGFTITVSSPKGVDMARILPARHSDARVGDHAAIDGHPRAPDRIRSSLGCDLLDLAEQVQEL